MIANISIFCVSSLLLLNLVGAKPLTSLQSLQQLLDEEVNTPFVESEMEQKDARAEKSALNERAEQLWESDARNSALAGKDSAFERLLGDLLSTSKRSWSRFKKGGLRSCFGVRLERIGSFSGLGC
ncbi:C-type natriuretic peptide 3-like isoform X2 [Carassius auratus]|uniref:C-type natriuretic peptide 3-like isoform X2 n=1 Tax=Carassius auratus TaxID=7957 RepID=A0A6P6PAJ0_CARAU|nr:C-type natriuretic peptide 3-like isoform X2 [Carassius auratus]XP_052459546.1 C-type natriuretic peptide 3-like isoform X2 [Carassius gibelio]